MITDDVISSAISAASQRSGSSFTISDVYEILGYRRKSRREQIHCRAVIPHQKIIALIKRGGYIRIGRGRYA